MLVKRMTVELIFCIISTCYMTERTSHEVIFAKENSSVLLVCPFLKDNGTIIWRGPPSLHVYGIDEKINETPFNIKHIAVKKKNQKIQFNLQIESFSRIDQGLFRCDTFRDSKPVNHSIKAVMAESPFDITLVSDDKSDMVSGIEGEDLEVKCFVEGGLPEPAVRLYYEDTQVNVTNSSMLKYTFVPSKDDSFNCFTCAADNGFYTIQTSKLLLVYGPPECLYEDKNKRYSINEDISFTFDVYYHSRHLTLKCFDNMYKTFNNCTQYTLSVENKTFSFQSCNRSFTVGGYAISMRFSAKDFLNSSVLLINVGNQYGNENCTFTFQIDEGVKRNKHLNCFDTVHSDTRTLSLILIHTVICGLFALLFCMARYSLKHCKKAMTCQRTQRTGKNCSAKQTL